MVHPRQPNSEEVGILQQAFHSFDQAAATLQESYRALAARLERLDLELAASNEALRLNLREKEEMRSHLEAILESLSTGVIVADQTGTVIRCNQAAVTFLGLPRTHVLGHELTALLRETHVESDTYPVVAPSGALLALSRTTLLENSGREDSGKATGIILLLHDITRLRQLEERLQRPDRLAAMGEMVGRIAHEIRNPLGSVELFASMLKRDLGDQPEQRAYAEHISVAVRAADRLLSNLLVYTRPNRPSAKWHETEPLVLDALTLAAHAIAQAPIEIVLRLDQDVSKLWCDASQMKQVLLNLILNAIQAMPGGGTLALAVTRDQDAEGDLPMIRLSVSDTGTGIDPVVRSRVFDPFFTTKDDGTGLGLAIVHTIVAAHKGRIEVETLREHGTTFTVLLPAHAQADPERKSEDAALPHCVT